MRRVVDADTVRAWAHTCLSALGDARAEIDALNVFPVPDGDTGTNLFLTMEAACAAVDEAYAQSGGDPDALVDVEADVADPPPDGVQLHAVARALSTGALLGARGNSGVILSQILRGTGEILAETPDGVRFGGDLVRQVLRRSADLAYQAVAKPVEGTMLTVARAAAEAAEAVAGDDLVAVVTAAAEGAREALERTPMQLEALRRAGVVDSGGRGVVVLYDTLLDVVTGVHRSSAPVHLPNPHPVDAGAPAHYAGPAYEVMYLLDADDAGVPALKDRLAGLGDSLVVVGGDGLWNVHVHVDDAGAAVEAALDAGRPYRIRITHLETADVLRESGRGQRSQRALVVVAHGPGIAALLESDGATIVPAAPRKRPSTGEILEAILRASAGEVIVLPSDGDVRAVAEAAAEEARSSGVRVAVIPTRSVVQSLAAVAVHEPGARFDDDVVAMTRAAGATHYGAVTVASREAVTTAGVCQPGDVLGLADGDIVEIGQAPGDVAAAILDRLLSAGGELATVVTGLDAEPALVDGVLEHLRRRHPTVEPVVYDGGQPLWPLIVGVE